MNILGISAYYHDSSAALVSDGRILAAAAEERFTLQKHDPNFPKFAIEYCLGEAGLKPQELDAVVFYEDPHVKFSRVFASTLSNFPFSRAAFARSMKSWMGSKLWTLNEISKRLDIHPSKVECIPHHASHASQAFASSSFDEAAILVVDAVGEWVSTSLYHGRYGNGLELKLLDEILYPHSLGLVYSAFAAFLGFRVNDGESDVMALAAFGRPRLAEKVRKVLQPQRDGTYAVDPSYFTFDEFKQTPFSRKFLREFGPPRNFKDALPFDCRDARSPNDVSAEHRHYADIAASVQHVLEEVLLSLCRKLRAATKSNNLCLAGGVALNCVANSKILDSSVFDHLFIPPDPGDGGAAAGAALYLYFKKGGSRAADRRPTPYLGKAYDPSADIAMLNHVNPQFRLQHRGAAMIPARAMELEVHSALDPAALAVQTTDDLRKGKIVGWVRGRFENGPRALGNRSILTDPANVATSQRLSRLVKHRAPFRPYALSIAEEGASRVLGWSRDIPQAGRWMQLAVKIVDQARPAVAAAMHIDATTRPQVCGREDNPEFHKLLSVFGQTSGLPALLNTSFNASGFPMVSSPAEAMLFFLRTEMDTLILGDTLLRKPRP